MVLIPAIGHQVNGSRRWIHLGPVNFQPSELARWLLLVYVAVFAVRHQTELRSSAQATSVIALHDIGMKSLV